MNSETKQKILSTTSSNTSGIKKALITHQQLCQKNNQDREEYLKNIVKDLRDRNNSGHVSVTQIIARERARYNYNTIRRVLKNSKSKGIKYLDVPDNNTPGNWIRLTDLQQIEDAILERNMRHFNQAANTPFAQKDLMQLFGYKGTNITSQRLIKQKIIPKDIQYTNEYVQQFISKLANNSELKTSRDITFNEFSSGLQNWNKKTTTSPSGRHLGHYKILLKLNVFDETDKNINKSNLILELIYNILMPSIYLGKPLQRWKQVTTMMIEKIPNV
jgi:hypothetical protein